MFFHHRYCWQTFDLIQMSPAASKGVGRRAGDGLERQKPNKTRHSWWSDIGGERANTCTWGQGNGLLKFEWWNMRMDTDYKWWTCNLSRVGRVPEINNVRQPVTHRIFIQFSTSTTAISCQKKDLNLKIDKSSFLEEVFIFTYYSHVGSACFWKLLTCRMLAKARKKTSESLQFVSVNKNQNFKRWSARRQRDQGH